MFISIQSIARGFKRIKLMIGYIYQIKNEINNKIYIGQTSNKYPNTRWSAHKLDFRKRKDMRKYPLYRAFLKYGIENFSFSVLLKINVEELDYWEQKLISDLDTLAPNGYNATKGGKSLRGDKNPAFGKPAWNRGIPRTELEKENIRNNTKNRKSFVGKANGMFGKIAPNRGIKPSKESIDKNRLSQNTRKEIDMLDKNGIFIRKFVSLGEASEWIRNNTNYKKADYSTINKVGKGIGKTAYGFIWEFSNKQGD